MGRTIMHVDMNAFFAAVEQLDNPGLRGKPVIVGGDPSGRGVVSTASYEARAFGVRSGMPLGRARALCPSAVFVRGNYRRYAEVSEGVFAILRRFSPLVEPFSIDEAFVDLSGTERLWGEPEVVAREVKRLLRESYALTASIGIAPNKLLAKMASDLEKPDGLVVLREEDVEKVLWPLPAGRLFGVGEKTAEKLRSLGIETVADLAGAPAAALAAAFGEEAARLLKDLAFGRDDSEVRPGHAPPSSLGREETFRRDVRDLEELRAVLWRQVQEVGYRLRSGGYCGRTVTVKIRYSDFTTVTRSRTLPLPTDLDEEIREGADGLLMEHWQRGRPTRLLGVSVSNLVRGQRQPDLFGDVEKRLRLNRAVDGLKGKFGEGIIVKGGKDHEMGRNRRKRDLQSGPS